MTTHRPIAPIAINGFEPGGTTRAYPIFEDVDPCTLLVDEGYQRDSSERSLKLVRKIVAGWDWAKFKTPVAVLADAGLELIDGQHTAIAAATHPDIAKIPVMIVEVPERKERAEAFIGQNMNKVAVTSAQLHVAAVAAGIGEAQAIELVCREAGVTIMRAQPGAGRWKPAQTIAVTAIGALIRGRSENVAVRVMSCLARAGLAPINQLHIKAADMLLNVDEYSSQITSETLTATIQTMGPKIDSEAALFRAAHPSTPAWKAMAIVWFKNRRGVKVAQTDPVKTRAGKAIEEINVKPLGKTLAAIARTPPAPITEHENRPRVLLPPDRKGESIMGGAKKDVRPAVGGWMPGTHLRRCGPCGAQYVGGVRSTDCADCAYRAEEVMRA